MVKLVQRSIQHGMMQEAVRPVHAKFGKSKEEGDRDGQIPERICSNILVKHAVPFVNAPERKQVDQSETK